VKQVVQSISGGPVRVIDVPRPTIGPTEVLVQTQSSLISPGTERAVTELARSSLLAKARARPDLVRQVVKKARSDGLARTARAVRTRLDDDIPLGYSAAGIAVEVGEAVTGVVPGQLVATAGAGKANHAEFQAVPSLLCAAVPDGVPPADAAFATIASIALHGLRLAEVGPGAKVVVIGLGLLGQLSVRLAQAAGCDVAGIDVADFPVEKARASGAFAMGESGDDTTTAILEWSRGRGADAVLLTAAGRSSAPALRAPAICRDRAEVVVVGDIGLELQRTPFYEKELSVRFARSYGPGRHERSYEEWAVDYPIGFVRWTEGRNMEAVLDLLSGSRLLVSDLVTHGFPITEAPSAYELIEARDEPYLGIALTYPPQSALERPIAIATPQPSSGLGVGFVGAGAFASNVLVPAFRAAGFERLVTVASGSGLSARRLAESAGFEKAVSGADGVIEDPDVDIVVVATPHDTHAALAARGLRAGKHVFCEKPLALSIEELDDVEAAWGESGRVLFVGFNRRWSRSIRMVRDHFAGGSGPLVVTYRVNAGRLPVDHWYNDRRQGGRLLGEVCHFVDTCAAIVGADAVQVHAAASSGHGELLLADDLALLLRYRDGSLATIAYASGGSVDTEKERIEVLGRGLSATVIDFRTVLLNRKKHSFAAQDKGHRNEVATFARSINEGHVASSRSCTSSMRTTLEAVAALHGGFDPFAGQKASL
jgi:predicted dehydrogenase/threonine dehydrogenase-like Zn-dependent dehydrogenase